MASNLDLMTAFDQPGGLLRRLLDWPAVVDLTNDNWMNVEEFEDDGELVVRAEMPGIDPAEDVDVTLHDHTLRIHAERRQETKTEEKRGYRSEFRYGSFDRAVRLPAGATEADVRASYNDGILEVRVPIDKGEAQAHKIAVTRGDTD